MVMLNSRVGLNVKVWRCLEFLPGHKVLRLKVSMHDDHELEGLAVVSGPQSISVLPKC